MQTAPALSCIECGLYKSATKCVLPQGPEDAEILFVGEAPGQEEDRTGTPFVDWAASGAELALMLARCGIDRSSVRITNILRCRPPRNRDPKPNEIDCCNKFLAPELRHRKWIVAVGAYATRFLLGPKANLDTVHGIPHKLENSKTIVLPVYHPAAGLREPMYMMRCQADFKILGDLVKGKLLPRHITDPYEGKEKYVEVKDGDLY